MPLPPNLVDIVLAHAQADEESLVDALQDATTYRKIAHLTLAFWYEEREHRLRLERQLKNFMGVEE